jgi:hypothetical protein
MMPALDRVFDRQTRYPNVRSKGAGMLLPEGGCYTQQISPSERPTARPRKSGNRSEPPDRRQPRSWTAAGLLPQAEPIDADYERPVEEHP